MHRTDMELIGVSKVLLAALGCDLCLLDSVHWQALVYVIALFGLDASNSELDKTFIKSTCLQLAQCSNVAELKTVTKQYLSSKLCILF